MPFVCGDDDVHVRPEEVIPALLDRGKEVVCL